MVHLLSTHDIMAKRIISSKVLLFFFISTKKFGNFIVGLLNQIDGLLFNVVDELINFLK